jgi:uncharacterized protein (TIGR00369 family)
MKGRSWPHQTKKIVMVMLKTESSIPAWVPEGYRKLGWHAGFDVLIGPMYYKKDEDGNFKFITKILDKHLNANGVAHGGFSMTLTDIFFGTLAFVASGKKLTSTVSLNCNFVSPGLQDEIIECEAKVTRTTRSMVFIDGNLISKDKVIVSASGIWKILNQ